MHQVLNEFFVIYTLQRTLTSPRDDGKYGAEEGWVKQGGASVVAD